MKKIIGYWPYLAIGIVLAFLTHSYGVFDYVRDCCHSDSSGGGCANGRCYPAAPAPVVPPSVVPSPFRWIGNYTGRSTPRGHAGGIVELRIVAGDGRGNFVCYQYVNRRLVCRGRGVLSQNILMVQWIAVAPYCGQGTSVYRYENGCIIGEFTWVDLFNPPGIGRASDGTERYEVRDNVEGQ